MFPAPDRSMPPGTRSAWVWLAAALALPRLWLLGMGPDAQLSLMMDDASYYLEAARRVVETHGWPSTDGVHLTNGFHPLYMALVILLQALLGTDPHVVVPAVMALQLVANGLAVVLLVRLVVEPAGGAAAAAAAGVLLALSPGWIVHGTCGVETGLSALLVLAVVRQWDVRYGGEIVRPAAQPALRDGALLGLAVLGRTDAMLLAVVYALAGGLEVRRTHGPQAALAGVAWLGLGALLVVSPWWIANLRLFGTVAQDSGAALAARFTTDYGPRTSMASLRVEAVGVAFWVYRFLWAGGFVPLTAWLLALALPFDRLRLTQRKGLLSWAVAALCAASLLLRANDPTDVRDVREAALELGLGLVAFGVGLFTERPARARMRRVHVMAFVAATLTVATYAVGFRGFQVWYAAGFSLAAILFTAWGALPSMLEGRRGLATVLVALMAVQCGLVLRGWSTAGGREGMDRARLAHGAELRARLDAFAAREPGPVRYGSFDSGELAYLLHPLPVVNLDGVMNHDAAVAIGEHRLGEWIRSQGITHLLTDSTRIAQYRRLGDFPARRDSAATARIGMETWRTGPWPGDGR